jgi:DNA-binding transcriptional regulator LsrR (DeoR family)
MTLIRTESLASAAPTPAAHVRHPVSIADSDAPPALTEAPSIEQTVRAWRNAGHSQRAIARELNLDRRKVKRILDRAT